MAQVRDQRFNMFMSKGELAILRKLANANGMSASDLVRHLVHKAHREFSREAGPKAVRT